MPIKKEKLDAIKGYREYQRKSGIAADNSGTSSGAASGRKAAKIRQEKLDAIPNYRSGSTGASNTPAAAAPQATAEPTTEKRGFFSRVGDTIHGGAKGSLAANSNAMSTLYAIGQGGRDAQNREYLEEYSHNLERAKLDMDAMLSENQKTPGSWSERDIQSQQYIIDDWQRKYDAMAKVLGEQVQQKATQASYVLADDIQQSSAKDIERAKEGLGGVGRVLVDAGASMTQTALDSAANALLGTPGSMGAFAMRAFGGGTQQARQDNPDSTLGQQVLYGTASAAKEVFTEKMFNIALPFSKAYGGGALDDVVERGIRSAVDRFAKTEAGKRVLGGALTFGAGAVSEGLEEFIGDWMEWQMPRIYDGDVASAGETLENSLYDFLVGATSGMMGSVVTPATYHYNVGESGTQQEASAPAAQTEAGAAANDLLTQAAEQAGRDGSISGKTADRILTDREAMTALERAAGQVVQDGMTKSQQRKAVKSAVETLARAQAEDADGAAGTNAHNGADALMQVIGNGERVDHTTLTEEQLAAWNDHEDVWLDGAGKVYQMDPAQHISQRTYESVGSRNVNAFQFDHPELRRYYQQAAEQLIKDASLSLDAPQTRRVERGMQGKKYINEILETPSLRSAMDMGLTRSEIIKAAEDLIADNGQENYAAAKRLEFVLDDMLTDGYTTAEGGTVGPNEWYVKAKEGIPGYQAEQRDTLPIWDMDEAAGVEMQAQGEGDAATGRRRTDAELAYDIIRVRRAAASLGENGARALTAAYDETTARQYAPETVLRDFTQAYNAALEGKPDAANTTMPEHLRIAAESAGQRDALRAAQARYFGEGAGLAKDDSYRKAHLSSKTRDALDALGKALGVQIKFAETVADGRANAQYTDGTIILALDAKDPVLTSAVHEAVHRIRETSPDAYSTLADFVQQAMTAEGLDFNLAERARLYGTQDTNLLTEETVADAFGRMLGDEETLGRFAQEHRSVAQKVMDVLRDIVNAVKRVLGKQDLKLTREQRAAFQALDGQMSAMTALFEDALKSANTQAAARQAKSLQGQNSDDTMGTTRNSLKEDGEDGPEGTQGTGHFAREGAQNRQGGQAVRGTSAEILRGDAVPRGGRRGLTASFGAKPVRTWAEGHIVEPAKGSVAYTEQQTAMDYGVPSFVVADAAWAKNKGSTPAFSASGQIFFRETMPEKNRGMFATHEITHVMKQTGYTPYLDFVDKTPDMLDMSTLEARILLEHSAKHRGIDLLDTALSEADQLKVYDELNATLYGHISSGKMDGLNEVLHKAFRDFDAYAAELRSLHERFKADNQKETKFSLKSPVEETRDLLALHNKDEKSILAALELGGLPMPSIAVVKASEGHSKYGPISLVFNKATIDPQADSRNKVYGGDAWTPTSPRLEYEANSDAEERLRSKYYELAERVGYDNARPLYDYAHELEDALNSNGGEAGLLERHKDDTRMMNLFLADSGQNMVQDINTETVTRLDDEKIKLYDHLIQRLGEDVIGEMRPVGGESPLLARKRWVEAHGTELEAAYSSYLAEHGIDGETLPAKKLMPELVRARNYLANGPETRRMEFDAEATHKAIREAVDPAKYEAWLHNLFDGAEGRKGLYNGKEIIDRNGNRRAWGYLHYAYTLENIVKAMRDVQSERGQSFWGVSATGIQALATPSYKSIQDIKADSGRLGLEEGSEYGAKVKLVDDAINNVLGKIVKKTGGTMDYDYAAAALKNAAGGKKTVDAIIKSFAADGYKISSKTAQDIQAVYKAALEIPTGYFEAKPRRAVGFDEVLAAVIPDDSSEKLRDGLEQAGVRMLEYKTGDDADRLAKINSIDDARFSRSDRELLADYVKEYGAIPKGETPSREITLPKKTGDGKNLSRTVRTILEAGATPETMVPNIEKLAARGDFSYDTYTDRQAVSDAESTIRKVGWGQALTDWTASMKRGEVSKANTAMGWALYNNAANSGDTKTALTVLEQMVEHQRSAAQALQATRILKKMSPETQLYGVQRSVENLQEELNQRFGEKNGPELKIDQNLAERFMQAKDQEGRDAALKDIYRDIGRQVPSRFMDKWNAWRYLAMLGNPRTHVRNVLGNAGFAPVVAAKDLTATAIEEAVWRVSGGKLERSKAMVGFGKNDRALLGAAWGDYAKVQETALGGGKYSDFSNANRYVEEGRVIFKLKPLEKARKANSAALDAEDVWFSKPHYAYAMAQYCKAHSITAEQIASGKGLKEARSYAILEAQKATYRDTNAFSQTMSELGRSARPGKNKARKGIALAMEGILPFRKTPANILARGVEYSPIGLMNGIKEAVWDVQKGKKTGAEAIDTISAGLSGTGLLALGLYLASQGLVRGHGGDDDKRKNFEEMQGHQAYALELPNGTSVTLDWLAPECLPFFVGVNLWEQTGGEKDAVTLSTMLSSAATVSEPLLEMSCLQSLNDVFDAVGYASGDGLDGLPAALASAATSYLTQALPTVLGQAERTGEDKRYTTYTEKNAFLTSDMQYTLGRASARIPGFDYQQIPYIDAWGRVEQSGSPSARAFNNFLNPAYTSSIDTSSMERELERLYEATGEGGVLPSRAAKYFTVDGARKDLTAEEYVRYATLKGQQSYELLSNLVSSQQYAAMSDQEKADAVKDAYKLANQTAKEAVCSYTPDTWVSSAAEAERKYGISRETYITLRTKTAGIQSMKDKDGESIANSKGLLIMQEVYKTPGLTDKQRQAMFEYLGVGKTVRHLNKAAVNEKLEKLRKQAG